MSLLIKISRNFQEDQLLKVSNLSEIIGEDHLGVIAIGERFKPLFITYSTSSGYLIEILTSGIKNSSGTGFQPQDYFRPDDGPIFWGDQKFSFLEIEEEYSVLAKINPKKILTPIKRLKLRIGALEKNYPLYNLPMTIGSAPSNHLHINFPGIVEYQDQITVSENEIIFTKDNDSNKYQNNKIELGKNGLLLEVFELRRIRHQN